MSRFVSLVFSGLFWFMLSTALVVCNDTFAYFCGFFFGKKIINRPFLKLSPNKTWEGFIGGGLCTIIFSFFWPTLWTNVSWVMCPAQDVSFTPFLNNLSCELDPVFVSTEYAVPQLLAPLFGATITILPAQLHCLALACYASVFAPFGGFFASAIKRAYNKKDFASFIPGHGGFTDRFDCQFLMLLCTSIHLNTFVRSQVTQVMTSILSMSDEQQREIYDKLASHLSA